MGQGGKGAEGCSAFEVDADKTEKIRRIGGDQFGEKPLDEHTLAATGFAPHQDVWALCNQVDRGSWASKVGIQVMWVPEVPHYFR
jgi:hypothetical protein